MKISTAIVKTFFKTPRNQNFFFGYYDISPLSKDNTKLLAQKASFNDRMPTENDELEIGYFDLKTRNWIPLTTTKAWNWQLGSRLQWVGPEFNRFIIYNDKKNDRFVSYILDLETKEKIEIPAPIFSVSSNGKYAVTLSFERLYHTRYGYGYAGVEDKNRNCKIPENDGIYLVDLRNKTVNLIISIKKLYGIRHIPVMDYGFHWVNHLMFNPSGTRFLFVHRFNLPDGGIYTRVYTSDIWGKDIFLILDSGNAGHYTWRNNEEILIEACEPSNLQKLRKGKFNSFLKLILPVYRKVIAQRFPKIRQKLVRHYYLLLKDKTNRLIRVGEGIFPALGHPSFNPVYRDWFVADTYEDKKNYRHLFLFNIKTEKLYHLSSFYSPPEFNSNPQRCDLHPKWSFDGKIIFIDYINNKGKRGILGIDISKIVKNSFISEAFYVGLDQVFQSLFAFALSILLARCRRWGSY